MNHDELLLHPFEALLAGMVTWAPNHTPWRAETGTGDGGDGTVSKNLGEKM